MADDPAPEPDEEYSRDRAVAINEAILGTAVVLYEELSNTENPPSEDFLRGMVRLGMYLTNTDPSEVEKWVVEVRKELLILHQMVKDQTEVAPQV